MASRFHPDLAISGVASVALWLPASRLFTQPFIQAQIKESIRAPCHWPLCGEFTWDGWIPRTNGQQRGKCFHLMTSSWRKHKETTHNQTVSTRRYMNRFMFSNHLPFGCLFNSLSGPISKKHQSFHNWSFVRGIHQWPVNSPHIGPITRKKFPFHDVIMIFMGYSPTPHSDILVKRASRHLNSPAARLFVGQFA